MECLVRISDMIDTSDQASSIKLEEFLKKLLDKTYQKYASLNEIKGNDNLLVEIHCDNKTQITE